MFIIIISLVPSSFFPFSIQTASLPCVSCASQWSKKEKQQQLKNVVSKPPNPKFSLFFFADYYRCCGYCLLLRSVLYFSKIKILFFRMSFCFLYMCIHGILVTGMIVRSVLCVCVCVPLHKCSNMHRLEHNTIYMDYYCYYNQMKVI